MCGIVGILGQENVVPRLIDGLARLEYRGYDSAGIAVVNSRGTAVHRAVGKLNRLREVLDGVTPEGRVGLGHTRWATHGSTTEANAHPHQVGRLTLVHNGIFENHAALREELISQGVTLSSETDTEVVAACLIRLWAAKRTEIYLRVLRCCWTASLGLMHWLLWSTATPI